MAKYQQELSQQLYQYCRILYWYGMYDPIYFIRYSNIGNCYCNSHILYRQGCFGQPGKIFENRLIKLPHLTIM